MPGQWFACLTSVAVALAIAPCLWGQQFDAGQGADIAGTEWALPPQSQDRPGQHTVRVATVTADRVYVRCGPSRDYYPTGMLEKGAQVRVVRERPDGWVAIEPPEGSYSWVASEFVREIEPGVGEVIADDVPAWIGSDISPLRDHSQVSLKKGQRVRIRKKHVFPEDALQRVWLQIEPPEGEVRWVRGEYLAFESGTGGRVDPTQPPPSGSAVEFRGAQEEQPAIVADGVEPAGPSHESATQGTGSENRAGEYALRLFRETEQMFGQEMQKPLGERDLLTLKARYKQVVQLTDNPALRKVAQSRLELLEKEELRERLARRFLELVRRSREKDQQLLQFSQPRPVTADAGASPRPWSQTDFGAAAETNMADSFGTGGSPWFEDPFASEPAGWGQSERKKDPAEGVTNPTTSTARRTRQAAQVVLPPGYRMIEGVLHPAGRGPDGRGRYVLRDPRSGRVVGYVVETVGLSLEPYIGKLVRISGREVRPSEHGGGLMARRIEPVRRR